MIWPFHNYRVIRKLDSMVDFVVEKKGYIVGSYSDVSEKTWIKQSEHKSYQEAVEAMWILKAKDKAASTKTYEVLTSC